MSEAAAATPPDGAEPPGRGHGARPRPLSGRRRLLAYSAAALGGALAAVALAGVVLAAVDSAGTPAPPPMDFPAPVPAASASAPASAGTTTPAPAASATASDSLAATD
ncbi:hypothetical protein [Streptomyces tateyamensis]|uniref:hypothetical protein n=1 Tax=Streptomyces tateyamensis TaxID=565073 RepID=UPI0015E8A55B|nr:hypothetical protein [Streptomyces tateyamensis]